MTDWIFLSKEGKDQYINAMAEGSKTSPTNIDEFDYKSSNHPLVIRGILKKKLIQRCWKDHRDFYFMDTGYMGNLQNPLNPMGWKLYHRIVKNDLQHGNEIISRPADRFSKLKININNWKRGGKKILIAKPDEKPMKFYGLDLDQWLEDTIETIKRYTDRPIVVRERVKSREDRVVTNTLREALDDDVHCLVTFNSNSATESVLYGIPAFTLAPTHAAMPVTSQDLSQIESPYYPAKDKIFEWACHLAYGQFHVSELTNGTAIKILKETYEQT